MVSEVTILTRRSHSACDSPTENSSPALCIKVKFRLLSTARRAHQNAAPCLPVQVCTLPMPCHTLCCNLCLSVSLPHEDTVVYKPGRELSSETKLASTLILNLLAYRTVRNIFLLFRPPSSTFCFVTAARAD